MLTSSQYRNISPFDGFGQEGRCRRCRDISRAVSSACGTDVQTSRRHPGAGSGPLGYYGPSAGLRRPRPTRAPAFGPRRAARGNRGKCALCRPKPLRLHSRHCVRILHTTPLMLADVMPGGRQSLLHFTQRATGCAPCRPRGSHEVPVVSVLAVAGAMMRVHAGFRALTSPFEARLRLAPQGEGITDPSC
jgi:hypothetical protein